MLRVVAGVAMLGVVLGFISLFVHQLCHQTMAKRRTRRNRGRSRKADKSPRADRLDTPDIAASSEWHEVHRKSDATESWPSDATDEAGAADDWDEFAQRASRISMLTNPMRVRLPSTSGKPTHASSTEKGGLGASFPLRESQENFAAANPMTTNPVASKDGSRTSWL